jgi:Fe-S cluster biosynthesis and repair protein YggX
VCAECWQAWQQNEVMVINELRLNFMDPKAQEVLDAEMRRFLCLEGSPSAR